MKKLILLILCLTSTLSLLTAQDTKQTYEGYENFPECRVYNVKEDFKGVFEKIDSTSSSLTSLAAFYDKNTAKFDPKQSAANDKAYNLVCWTGYLPIKREGEYTFIIIWQTIPSDGQLGLKVNNQSKIAEDVVFGMMRGKQGALNVNLKPGMNKLCFCIYGSGLTRYNAPVIQYKLKDVIGDPRNFTPSNLYHQVVEIEW
ncbi:MAG: hypothetical protein IKX30_03360 [Victivallales bacterium]|nr:hypothetical protein [Victivallales bacterium]